MSVFHHEVDGSSESFAGAYRSGEYLPMEYSVKDAVRFDEIDKACIQLIFFFRASGLQSNTVGTTFSTHTLPAVTRAVIQDLQQYLSGADHDHNTPIAAKPCPIPCLVEFGDMGPGNVRFSYLANVRQILARFLHSLLNKAVLGVCTEAFPRL